MSDISDQAKRAVDRGRLRHDVMAPLCNIRAFTGEVEYIAESLAGFLEDHGHLLPDEGKKVLVEIVHDDIKMCTGALARAADNLETQIDDLISAVTEN